MHKKAEKVFIKYKQLLETKDFKGISLLKTSELVVLFYIWWHLTPIEFIKCENDLLEVKRDFPVKYKVSFCINIMGRLDELKATLLKNIKENKDYPYFEVVLLNYDGDQKVDEYIKSKFMLYIELGVLNYYKNLDFTPYYKMCHSRNITGRLAEGDIVAFMDADNFVNDFVYFLNAVPQYLQNDKIIYIMTRLRRGRLALFKNKFLELGGYDESMDPRWWQDRDLEYRAQASGFASVMYSKYSYYNKALVKNWTNAKQYENYSEDLIPIFSRNHLRIKYVWKLMQQTITNLLNNNLIANKDIEWGSGSFLKNFTTIVKI